MLIKGDIKMKKIVMVISIASSFILGGCSSEIKVSQSKDCWIDGIQGDSSELVNVHKKIVNFTGWAVDSTKLVAPELLAVQIVDKRGAIVLSKHTDVFTSRKDIVKVFNEPAYDNVGFTVDLDLSVLEPGEYPISIALQSKDYFVVCPTNKKIHLN
jgi:hypothetical protein